MAVLVAAVDGVFDDSVYYIVFGKARMRLLGNDPDAGADMRKVPAWKMVIEFARGFVVALVLAPLVVLSGDVSWMNVVQLGVWIGIGFPVMILLGTAMWDKRPWQLAVIHANDLTPNGCAWTHPYSHVGQRIFDLFQYETALSARQSGSDGTNRTFHGRQFLS